MATDDGAELVALVTWLQTFAVFSHRIVDGQDGKIALETVLDALGTPATARSIWKVAEEICGPSENSTDKNHSADEIWTSLLILTSTRARPLAESPVTNKKQMSPARLKLYVLSNLLDCAVQSADLEQRRAYIQGIMKLNRSTQKILMSLIEKRTKTTKKTPTKSSSSSSESKTSNSTGSDSKRQSSSSSSRSSERTKESLQQQQQHLQTPPRSSRISSSTYSTPERDSSSSSRPPANAHSRTRPSANMSPSGYTPASSRRKTESLLSPGTMDSPNAIQSVVNDLHSRNEKMQKAIETYKKRESDLQANLDTIHGDYRKQMLKLESSQRDHIQDMQAGYNEQIEASTIELKRYQALAEQGERAMKELAAARDELDVLQHNQASLHDAQEKLARYKKKLGELQDIKDAYEKEKDRHALSVEECIRLSNEVEQLKTAKCQLNEYKNRALQAEVKLVECQNYLKRLEEQTNQQSATNDVMMQGAAMQQEQLEEMRRRMEREAAELDTHGPGVGEGISEFNSEIAGELARLRNENVQLKVFASTRQHDAVSRLENALEDTKLLAEKYKHEFLNANQNLASTQVSLNASIARENMLQDEIQQVKLHLDEIEHSKRLVQERLERCEHRLSLTQQQLDEAERRLADTREDLEQWQRRTREVEQESDERLRNWQAAKRELQETTHELEATGHMVLELQEQLSFQKEKVETVENNEKLLHQSIRDQDARIAEAERQLDAKEIALADANHRLDELNGHLACAKDSVDRIRMDNQKLNIKLDNERQARHDDVQEAHASLEATRKLLEQKHKKEYDAMLGTMNCQLDEERRESRLKADEYDKTMQEVDNNWREQYDELEKRLVETVNTARHDAQQRIEQLKQEHAKELQKYRTDAETSRQNLMARGHAMLDEAKLKAQQEIKVYEERLQNAMQEKEDVESLLRKKFYALKEKHNQSANEAFNLNQEMEDLQVRVQEVERERLKLQEDNDRYKRQLGGHFGVDNFSQAQLEKLQNEYAALLQENRNLKRVSSISDRGSIADAEPDATGMYNRAGKRGESYQQQMRRDYEDQIDSLNNEKRSLFMEASAAVIEAKKAEQRAWEREEELERLKRELYELKLGASRQGRQTSSSSVESIGPMENIPPSEETSFLSEKNSSFHTARSGITPVQSKTPERRRAPSWSPTIEKALKNRDSQENNLRSQMSKLTRSTPPQSSPPPPRITTPIRKSGMTPRSVSGQRYKIGVSLLDSELDTTKHSAHNHILSPTNKHRQQANQQLPTSASPDFMGVPSHSGTMVAKARSGPDTLSDVSRFELAGSRAADANLSDAIRSDREGNSKVEAPSGCATS